MKTIATVLMAALCAGPALADGTGHDHSSMAMPGMSAMAAAETMGGLGTPGTATETSRTVTVTMGETEEGAMVFDPARLEFAAGETVRILLVNKGAQEHEFVMGTAKEVAEHKAMMEAMPDMVHTAPNALRLAPGASGEITWTFGTAGSYEFACLVPGHYDAGMHGPLTVK